MNKIKRAPSEKLTKPIKAILLEGLRRGFFDGDELVLLRNFLSSGARLGLERMVIVKGRDEVERLEALEKLISTEKASRTEALLVYTLRKAGYIVERDETKQN